MKPILSDDPRWVIDKEPVENAGLVAPVPIEPTTITEELPQVVEQPIPEQVKSSLPAPNPAPEEDRRLGSNVELPTPQDLPPAEMIDKYRDYDFRAMIDPEDGNHYGRNDEGVVDILGKWGGQTQLGGLKGAIQGGLLSDAMGVTLSDAGQLSDAISRFKNAPTSVINSPEGVEYMRYLRARLDEAVNPVDIPLGEMGGLFADALVNAPGETLEGLAWMVVDDPLAFLGFAKAYNTSKAAGMAMSKAHRFNKLLLRLSKQGAKGKAASTILRNVTKIAPVVATEAIVAGGYQALTNVARGAPIDHAVTTMSQLAALMGGTVRGIGVRLENSRVTGSYRGRSADDVKAETTVDKSMADLQDATGGKVRPGAVVDDIVDDSGQMELLGMPTGPTVARQMERARAAKLAAERAREQAKRNGEDSVEYLKGDIGDFRKILKQGLDKVYDITGLSRGWKVRTGFTDLSKGSGLVNYNKDSKIITLDIGRLTGDPVKSFSNYVKPNLNSAFGRTYDAAAKRLGFDTQELSKLMSTPEEMARFAILKEKYYIASHSRLPAKTGATKAYKDARNLYRHEHSLYNAVKDMGYDVKRLNKPSQWKATKAQVSEAVSEILNNKIKPNVATLKDKVVTPALAKGKQVYREKLGAANREKLNETYGNPIPNPKPVPLRETVGAVASGVKAGVKAGVSEATQGFKGLFDDGPMQFGIQLEKRNPFSKKQRVKGIKTSRVSSVMDLITRNKLGALSMLLGHNPHPMVLANQRGREHIDKWMGDNSIMDRHAMSFQHRIMNKLPDEDTRRAATHYIEGTLDRYNMMRRARGEAEVHLSSGDRAYIDSTLRPIFSNMFKWAMKHKLIPRDADGGMRYRHNFVFHVPKRDFLTSFEEYLTELTENVKSGVSMKASTAYSRTFKTIIDAEEAGYPMHTDIAKVMSTYMRGIWRVESNKKLVKSLTTSKVGDNTIVMPRDSAPDYYREIKHPVFMDIDGKYMKVDPALFEDLKIVFDTSDPTTLRRVAINVNTSLKRIAVGLSLFHAVALGQSALFSGQNPLKAYKQYGNALSRMRTGPMGDEIDSYLRAGLKIGGIDDVNSEALVHLMEATSASVDRFAPSTVSGKVAKMAPDTVKDVTEWIDAVTWDKAMTLGKIITMDKAYSDIVRADIKRARRVGGPLTSEDELMRQSAIYVNDAFGGLDWQRMGRTAERNGTHLVGSYMGTKHGRGNLQLGAFAPDWMAANFRVLFKSLPGATSNKEMGNLYRGYAARAAGIYLITGEGIQQAMTGTSIFDNEGERGWLRIHLGDGVYIRTSKQFTEPFDYVSRFKEGDLSPIGHRVSSLGHLLWDISKGESVGKAVGDAVTPFTISTIKSEGALGLSSAVGVPAVDYNKPWVDN